MHDLPTMYRRILDIVTTAASELFPHDGNARLYPVPPKLVSLRPPTPLAFKVPVRASSYLAAVHSG